MSTLSLPEFVKTHLVCPVSKLPLSVDPDEKSVVCKEVHVQYPVHHHTNQESRESISIAIPVLIPSMGKIIKPDS
jgi:hypothetical protein